MLTFTYLSPDGSVNSIIYIEAENQNDERGLTVNRYYICLFRYKTLGKDMNLSSLLSPPSRQLVSQPRPVYKS